MKIEEIKQANLIYKTEAKGYAISFKRQVIETLEQSAMSISEYSKATGIARPTIYRWQSQFNSGLYTLDAAVSVSAKVKKSSTKIMEQLLNEKRVIDEKIEIVKRAEELGLKVSVL